MAERPRATADSWKDDRLAVEQLKVVDITASKFGSITL